jgi:hypothetical protein
MSDEATTPPTPESTARLATFYDAGDGIDTLADAEPRGRDNALQKLGRPPFDRAARTRFRLLGFLATVYEHVSDIAKQRAASGSSSQ